LALARSKLLSLRISISLLTTKDELKSIRDATKLTGDAHEKDVLRRLFSPWPWNQPLSVDNMHSFRPARLGRALMNSLRTITEDFKDWSELQQRTFREEALAKVHARIDSAISSGSKADILVAFGEVREYAQRVFSAEVSQAERNYGDFPFPEFKEVLDGRQRQLLACPTFFDEISRRFKNESGRKQLDEQENWIIGAHIAFFQHFKAGDVSVEDSDELLRLGQKFSSLSTSAGGGAAAGSAASGGSSTTPAASSRTVAAAPSPAGGGGSAPGRGGGAGKGNRSRSAPPANAQAKVRYALGVTLPSSESIIGPHLGIPGPAFSCHHCGEDGHWRGECPAFWGSKDLPLPGWRRNGKKDRNAWEGENPKKETFKAWVKFIKDNFENNGQPARVDGAPAFNDYKDRAVNGAGP
jgi:hypothetical protein